MYKKDKHKLCKKSKRRLKVPQLPIKLAPNKKFKLLAKTNYYNRHLY